VRRAAQVLEKVCLQELSTMNDEMLYAYGPDRIGYSWDTIYLRAWQ